MQDGLFFRILRRFNTLVLSLAILGAIALGGIAIWKHHIKWSHLFSDASEEMMGSSIPLNAATAYTMVPDSIYGQAGTYEYLRGNGVYILTRNVPSSSMAPAVSISPYGYGVQEIANVMVIDANADGHWLFKGVKRSILTRDAIHQGAQQSATIMAGPDPRPVIGLVMLVIEGDANKDGVFNERDPLQVTVWKKGATEAVKLLDIDEAVSLGLTDAEHYQVVYKKGTQTRAAAYSVPDFKLISDKVLPDTPK